MTSTLEELRTFIKKRGRPLDDVGVNDFAFHYEDAIELINALHGVGAPILGGDVYIARTEKPEMTRDSWYCDRTIDETDSAFVERSRARAFGFLEHFSAESEGPYLFTIVTPLHAVGEPLDPSDGPR